MTEYYTVRRSGTRKSIKWGRKEPLRLLAITHLSLRGASRVLEDYGIATYPSINA